jgi:O-acetyl-ADP-ribose deacetylase (regulator of RNase III)
MLTVILAGIHKDLIQAWSQVFGKRDNVTIYPGSIFDVACDALVSPANSFGFMDGGLDYQISEYLGWHVQERLQERIREKHHGELLVETADIVPTDHHKIPYVISAPTMRVPMILTETVNVYLATRAVFILIKFGAFDDGTPIQDRVKSVVFPGMGTGVGRVPPEICARQMHAAFEDIIEGKYMFPRLWPEAQKRHQLLYSEKSRDLQVPDKEEILNTLDTLKRELLKHKDKRQREREDKE